MGKTGEKTDCEKFLASPHWAPPTFSSTIYSLQGTYASYCCYCVYWDVRKHGILTYSSSSPTAHPWPSLPALFSFGNLMQETAPMFFQKKHEKENMFRLDISNLGTVDVHCANFKQGLYALLVCCYKKPTLCYYFIAVIGQIGCI